MFDFISYPLLVKNFSYLQQILEIKKNFALAKKAEMLKNSKLNINKKMSN